MKPEFVQLAKPYNPEKHNIVGWWVSEKLDGIRAWWDGGVSRGFWAHQVPWANTLKDKKPRRATGLWTRSMKPVSAPPEFIELLPEGLIVDGELYMGRGRFQDTMATVMDHTPKANWEHVKFVAHDLPNSAAMFRARDVKVRNDYTISIGPDAIDWWWTQMEDHTPVFESFEETIGHLSRHMPLFRANDEQPGGVYTNKFWKIAKLDLVASFLDDVLGMGGEGAMYRHPTLPWAPHRSHALLKHKPFDIDTGRVVGFTSGAETDKGSKYLGMIGAVIVETDGKRFKVSGFTDAEREFKTGDGFAVIAAENPGSTMPDFVDGKIIKRGSFIKYKYRELTDDGVPKEARYHRS